MGWVWDDSAGWAWSDEEGGGADDGQAASPAWWSQSDWGAPLSNDPETGPLWVDPQTGIYVNASGDYVTDAQNRYLTQEGPLNEGPEGPFDGAEAEGDEGEAEAGPAGPKAPDLAGIAKVVGELVDKQLAKSKFDEIQKAADRILQYAQLSGNIGLAEAQLAAAEVGRYISAEMTAAVHNASNRLQAVQLMSSLRGPRNAFVAEATRHGLNAAGLSRAVDAIAGTYYPPMYAGPQATPDPITMQKFLDDSGLVLPGEIKTPYTLGKVPIPTGESRRIQLQPIGTFDPRFAGTAGTVAPGGGAGGAGTAQRPALSVPFAPGAPTSPGPATAPGSLPSFSAEDTAGDTPLTEDELEPSGLSEEEEEAAAAPSEEEEGAAAAPSEEEEEEED